MNFDFSRPVCTSSDDDDFDTVHAQMMATTKQEKFSISEIQELSNWEWVSVLLRILGLASLLIVLVPAYADIAIVDTRHSTKSRELIEGVIDNCLQCGRIHVFDMEGRKKTGRTVLAKINDLESVDTVITLGWPATDLAAKFLDDRLLLFYTMTGNRKLVENRQRAVNISSVIQGKYQVDVLKKLFPSAKSISLLFSSGHSQDEMEDFKIGAEANDLIPIPIEINSIKDMPTALSKAITNSDIIVFFRSPNIINRDSINYIVQTTLENRKPSFAYTDALVSLGILGAIIPEYNKLGEKIGRTVSASFNSDDTTTETILDEYKIFINAVSLKHMDGFSSDESLVDRIEIHQ